MQTFPSGKSLRTSHSLSCTLCPVEFSDEFDVAPHDTADFSDEDSAGIPPSGAVAQSKFDAELAAMLAWATANIRLEWNSLPCPERLRLGD